MAENFRNKQWFKNLSQDRKDELCNKFNIDEKTLKKAGRETEDGRIVIDLLRIDHISYTPEIWDICYNAFINNNVFDNKLKWDFTGVDDMVIRMSSLYNFVNSDEKLLKYKSSLKNDLFVKDAYKRLLKWVNYAKEDLTDVNSVKFSSYQIYSHVRCLLDSDLKLVKH